MRFLIWARSILFPWATLLVLAYVVERPLIHWMAPLFGASWIATAHLALDGLTLTATGWVVGRFNRPKAILTAVLFAVTLCFWEFGETLGLNVPWLLRLVSNSFHDSRFLDSLIASAEINILLFGCLIAGAGLSRAREKMVSIVDD
jgi:hypothetical protein